MGAFLPGQVGCGSPRGHVEGVRQVRQEDLSDVRFFRVLMPHERVSDFFPKGNGELSRLLYGPIAF